MFDIGDIICGLLVLGFFAYILIDSYYFDKRMKQRRKETDEQRIKQGRKPIDWDAPAGSCYGGDSGAADSFRSTIFRNMGMMG